jgi:ATP-binding cassette, subfamily B, bacterial PglK
MKNTQPIYMLLKRLWVHISSQRRIQFGLLLILMSLSSFAEVVSIGAVLPFIGAISAPESLFSHPQAEFFIQTFGINTPDQLLFPLTIIFSFAALVAGVMRLLVLWLNTRLSYAAGADLSINIYRRTLYQPYKIHLGRNSSEIINGITRKAGTVISIITSLLNLISSSLMMVSILTAMLLVDPIVTISAFGGFGMIYIFIINLTRKRISSNSHIIARESTNIMKSLQEGLGSIRDILIGGTQDYYCKIYSKSDLPLRTAQGSSLFISTSPRFGIEALGMVLISILAYLLSQRADGIENSIPILGAFALGAQRLLPVLQTGYSAVTTIKSSHISFQDAIELLDQPLPSYKDKPIGNLLPFKKNIKLTQLSFRYSPEAPSVLDKLDLTIIKGSRVGFIGKTGTGKSTLIDIVMGLLQPTEGDLEVDGCVINSGNILNWQAHIVHVTQSIYLADSTIEENIAFGVAKNKIDHKRVLHAAQQSQIAETINILPKKYLTYVGERGVRLSGGQLQRIGIARALYKQADVIIFDEATNALDNETENSVMDAIQALGKDKTVLIIAHRLSTLKNCTQIVELSDGRISRSGTYQQMVTQANKSLRINSPLSQR